MSPVDRLEREIVDARPMCLSFLRDRLALSDEDAEDVFQIAFMRAARRLRQGSFKYKSSVTTWFLTIAQHVALDQIRSPAAKMCSLDALEGGDSAAAEKSWREPILGADCNRFFQPIPAPFARLCAVEHEQLIARTVEKLLSSLSAKLRSVVERFYLRGEDCFTIARDLTIPRATVLTRLHSARTALRRRFAERRIDGTPIQAILSDSQD